MAITRSNKVSLFNHLPNATKTSIFIRELLKDIRLDMPKLLMMSLKLLIPLRIPMITIWLPTIHLTRIQGNEGYLLNKMVLMFDPMLKHIT